MEMVRQNIQPVLEINIKYNNIMLVLYHWPKRTSTSSNFNKLMKLKYWNKKAQVTQNLEKSKVNK
jgi:hypothetical protein